MGTDIEPTPDGSPGVCFICAKVIDGDKTQVWTKSEQHPERTYHFSAHPACIKRVAEPRFAAVKDL